MQVNKTKKRVKMTGVDEYISTAQSFLQFNNSFQIDIILKIIQ